MIFNRKEGKQKGLHLIRWEDGRSLRDQLGRESWEFKN